MAEKINQAQPNVYTRRDEESASSQSNELKRKKRIRLAMYIAIFLVFQVIVITAFGLVIMRAKSPKLRLSNDIEFQNLNTATSGTASPSFDLTFSAQVRVKNSNFGPYKFDNTTATFTYGGATVGQVIIPKGKAGIKSTKKINVIVNLSSSQLSDTAKLGSELSAGTLTLTGTAKMSGRVELMMIMKKTKSANMDCTITIDVAAKTVRTFECN
ncbi:late embryogenesis abundant protein At1g64065-like [Humulus lupulus]|uniref:late embryogenesis abundant protein At1g64065-like n=1 Tax=Humulus lupulus TaxID=3486 RepID=UPI002B406602|nr:late embryogenesis abundant protein At1g64065-like [Humulus lupulus]